ncbi:MAG: toprim domain-containing protein, partial [Geminicoccaceae bacterium]|nr:toprim domain-containing protein [Geminicoccaceae bacterium]
MGEFVGHEPCPKCGSEDNFGRYDDGGGKCFGEGCGYFERSTDGSGGSSSKAFMAGVSSTADPEAVAKFRAAARGMGYPKDDLEDLIRPEVARKFHYLVGSDRHGRSCEMACYADWDGTICAGKIRYPNKGRDIESKVTKKGKVYFPWIGDGKAAGFFGHQLWGSGKRLIITEGERDCLAVAQAMKLEWPVVSIKTGAGDQAIKSVLEGMDFIRRFDEVVLMFDNDTPGQNAARAVAEALHHTMKVAIAAPFKGGQKDAWDCLKEGSSREILQSVWNARAYQPKDIVLMSTLRDAVWENNTVEGLPFPHDGLQERTRGTVEGDVVVICAGSGVGKTEFVTETLYHLHFARNEAVGVLFLEDPDIRTAERVVGRHLKKRLHIDRDGLTRAEFDKAWDEVFAHRDIPMLVEFGFSDPEALVHRIQYMAQVHGCSTIILDHISIVVSGMDASDNERKTLDLLMSRLKKAAVSLKIRIFIVSHLSRPEGNKGYEDGLVPTAKHLR